MKMAMDLFMEAHSGNDRTLATYRGFGGINKYTKSNGRPVSHCWIRGK